MACYDTKNFSFRHFIVNSFLKPSSQRQSWYLDLVLLALGCLIYYLVLLGSHGLVDPDEGRYGSVSVQMWQSGNWIVPYVNGAVFLDKPILSYWLQAIALSIFGLSNWSLRFFPAVSAVAAVLGVYWAARTIFSRRAGWLAATILATSPLFFGIGHFANMDMEVASFVTLSICCVWVAFHKVPGQVCTKLMLWAYFFSALAFLTKGLLGWAFPALILLLYVAVERKWSLLKKIAFGWGLLINLVVCLPWLIAIQIKQPWFFHYFFIYQQFDRFVGVTFNQQQPVWFYIELVAGGMLPWTFWMLQALGNRLRLVFKKSPERSAVVFVLIWFFLILAFFSIPASKLPGYIAPALPPMALLLAGYLDSAFQKGKTRGMQVGAGLVIVFWVGLAITLFLMPPALDQHLLVSVEGERVLLGFISSVSVILAVVWLWRKKYTWLVFQTAVFMVAFNWTALLLLPKLPINTLQSLYEKTAPYMTPSTKVVSFLTYYQALPIYYRHPVYVVADWTDPQAIMASDDWRRMLYRGTRYDVSGRHWLWSQTQFEKAWQHEKLMVWLPAGAWKAFENKYPHARMLFEYKSILVVSNTE